MQTPVIISSARPQHWMLIRYTFYVFCW